VNDEVRKARGWIATNVVVILYFFLVRMQEWAPPGAEAEGPGPADGLLDLLILFPVLIICVIANLTWLVTIFVGGFRTKRWSPMLIWITVFAAWIIALNISAAHSYHDIPPGTYSG